MVGHRLSIVFVSNPFEDLNCEERAVDMIGLLFKSMESIFILALVESGGVRRETHCDLIMSHLYVFLSIIYRDMFWFE